MDELIQQSINFKNPSPIRLGKGGKRLFLMSNLKTIVYLNHLSILTLINSLYLQQDLCYRLLLKFHEI